ncbi:MAG: DUF3887 domain-containing protein [Velocimicrobium sp.]
MKKLTKLILILTIIGVLLSGCSSTKLMDSFDKDTVEASAKQTVEYLNSEDYDSVVAMFNDDLKEQLTSADLKSGADSTFKDPGAFKEYKSVTAIGKKIKGTDEDAAVAVVVAQYENQKVIYTISFNTDMKIIGIFMK